MTFSFDWHLSLVYFILPNIIISAIYEVFFLKSQTKYELRINEKEIRRGNKT